MLRLAQSRHEIEIVIEILANPVSELGAGSADTETANHRDGLRTVKAIDANNLRTRRGGGSRLGVRRDARTPSPADDSAS